MHGRSQFSQIPDMLEAAWINVAMDEIEKRQRTTDMVSEQYPFEMKYEQIEPVEWEDCAEVLSAEGRRNRLLD